MDVRPVDPREASWEIHQPAYRVYFWRRVPQPIGLPMGFTAEEFQVTGADVRETIAWAEATAGPDRTYTLYAVAQRAEGELGLLRLAGADPLRTPHRLG